MLNKSKKIILTAAILTSISLFAKFGLDYADEGFPKKSYVYAPHREAYLAKKAKEKDIKNEKKEKRCFFCLVDKDERFKKEDLIKSFKFHNVSLSGFPYIKGHILISPKRHVSLFNDLTLSEKLELLNIISVSIDILQEALKPDGFNVGINIGKAGGATVDQHLHIHVVPRYFKENAYSGFMETTGKTRIIDWDIDNLAVLLRKHFDLVEEV